MNWDQYFNSLATAVAQKSKDPSRKVGCVIVDSDNRIVSQGYNGFVSNSDESQLSWDRPIKYHLVIHAEMNAILHARQNLRGCKMYITDAPCDNCLKHLLQSGVREVYYNTAEIMQKRGTPEQIEAIQRLINSTQAKVINVNTGTDYTIDILQKP